jgi:hypothetical protein
MEFNNTLGHAFATVLAMENCQTRKVMFEKSTFFIGIYQGNGHDKIINSKLKVREGKIEELDADAGLKEHCKVYGFYTVVDGEFKGEVVLKGELVKEFR